MKFLIRDAQISDAKAIHDIYGYYVDNTVITFNKENPSVEAYERAIKDTKRNYPYLVVTDEDDKVLGFAYGSKLRPHDAYIYNVESTIYLSPTAPKHTGIGRALYESFNERLGQMGYMYVYGVIEDSNEISIKMHEALGFEKVGHFTNIGYKFGKWRGIVWYRKLVGNLNNLTLGDENEK